MNIESIGVVIVGFVMMVLGKRMVEVLSLIVSK